MSICYRMKANDQGEAHAVLEQLFPASGDTPKVLSGPVADEIVRNPARLIVWKTCTRVDQPPETAGQKTTHTWADHKLEVSGQGHSFAIDGWGSEVSGVSLLGQVEKIIGCGGLTVVIEHGIIERPITATAQQA